MNLFRHKHTDTANSIIIDQSLQLDAITDKIIRIHTLEKNEQNYTPTDSLSYGSSFAIESSLDMTGIFSIHETGEQLHGQTSQLNLSFDSDLHLTISNKNNQVICSDYIGDLVEAETLSDEDIEQMVQEGHIVHTGDTQCNHKVVKRLFGDEAFYGLGDKTGFLNKKGYDYMMWNSDNPDPHVENPIFKALYKSIPFLLVLRDNFAYGIFLDNPYKTYFDLGYESSEYYSFSTAKGAMNYYFIYGDNLRDVISSYTSLTGRSPLPQMWTLGYQQSRWSYSSAQEVLTLAQNFRKYDIPCDAIHLDIDYMDDFKVFTSDKERFPDLKDLSNKLSEMGIKLVTIIDPGIKAEKDYFMYEEGLKNNYFAKTKDNQVYHNTVWPGDSVFPDFTSDKVRTWWGNQSKLLTEQGIRGIWNDMNEPASFNGPLPDDVVFPGDTSTSRFHQEVHNVYGHLMAKATYEGLKASDGKRPFVITRACYAGSQKYTTAWTGDNQSLWSHLKLSIPQLLNLGMSGLPLVGTDIGGFGSNTTPELLSRWIEASCFAPLFRNHSAKYTRRQEPWLFDSETLAINKKYIKLHYKFIPYIYDLCYQETQTGLPILRPLVLHYENDPVARECNDQYLVGDSILVAPVTEQGARARMVYLPEGIWIDYWTGQRIAGNQYIIKEAPMDICPIYIKGGSILPTWPDCHYIDSKQQRDLTLLFYPETSPEQIGDSMHSYMHYQDNGVDFAYENGEFNLYEFTYSPSAPNGVSIKMIQEGFVKYENIIAKIC